MTLTDEVCQQITQTVKALRLDHPRRRKSLQDDQAQVPMGSSALIDLSYTVMKSLEDYQARVLAPALAQHFLHVEPVARDTIGLMAYLGPPEGHYPPQPLRAACEKLVRQHSEKLVQVVLAYGCRWQRIVQSGIGRWDEHWPDAVKDLTYSAYNFVRSAVKTLQGSVRAFRVPDIEEQQGYAVDVAGRFVSLWPEPDRPKYTHYQTIHTWDPDKGSLYVWLQHAVQGLRGKQRRFPANMFVSGLLFPLLQNEHHLDTGPIAFRQCRHCGYPPEKPSADPAEQSEDHHLVEYHEESCTSCQAPYTPTACRFTLQDLLFVPEVYLQHPLRCCLNHQGRYKVYDAKLGICPDCHQKLSQTRSHPFVFHIWARSDALSNEQKIVHRDIQKERNDDSQA